MSMKKSSDTANMEVVNAVGDVSKKMDDFMNAVALLRDLEEKPARIEDEIAEAEKEKGQKVKEFEANLREHEMQTIQKVLDEQRKVAIDMEELDELRQLQKREDASERATKRARFETDVEARVATELKLKELEYEKRFAEAKAKETSFETERAILTQSIQDLRDEIASQKTLTSDLALGANRS